MDMQIARYRQEWWKIVITATTSAAIVGLGFVVNNSLNIEKARLDRGQQILLEKQRIYADLGAKLNIIYVYIRDVGDYANYTPPQVIDLKREADRQFNIYLPYWSKTTRNRYQIFMNSAFHTYTGAGLPAKIKATTDEKIAAGKSSGQTWDDRWSNLFSEVEKDPQIADKYESLVESFIDDTVQVVSVTK